MAILEVNVRFFILTFVPSQRYMTSADGAVMLPTIKAHGKLRKLQHICKF